MNNIVNKIKMLKDKHSLLKLNFKKQIPQLFNMFDYIFESLYALYDLILDNQIENFWYEIFNIIISYLQLIAFIFDKTVSII